MSERGLTVMTITQGEALGAQIADTMVQVGLEALRAGGYRPTPEKLAQLSTGLTQTALAMAHLVVESGPPAPSDDQIDQAAELATHAVVREVFGPPPMAH